MSLRGGLLLIAALFASACVSGSEQPLFDLADAAHPIADGREFGRLRRPYGEGYNVRFVRRGANYRVERNDAPGENIEVMFVAIDQTSEEDYIAQVHFGRHDDERVAYAFVWAMGARFRVFPDLSAVAEDGVAYREAQASCNSECRFESRDDAIGYYLRVVYPGFVQGNARPQRFLDLGGPIRPDASITIDDEDEE